VNWIRFKAGSHGTQDHYRSAAKFIEMLTEFIGGYEMGMAAERKDKKDRKEKGKVKTEKLKLQKVTAKELTEGELDKVQGGYRRVIIRN